MTAAAPSPTLARRLPLALVGAGGALLAAGGVAFYRRPFRTLRALLRLRLRLAGVRERRVTVNGVPLRYFEIKPGRSARGGRAAPDALVLIPGLGDSAETWTDLLLALPRDRRILAVELAGFGRTPPPPEGMRFSVLTDYFARFLDAAGVRRAALAGNSLGGAVAIRYAARHPGRVTHLFPIDSAGLLGAAPAVLEPATRELAQELVRVTVGPGRRLPRFILDDLLRNVRAPARRAYLASGEPTDVREDLPRLGALGIPTTIVWGEHDQLIPLENGARLRDAIAGAELLVLRGAGHSPQSDAPRAVARILRERLQREQPGVTQE